MSGFLSEAWRRFLSLYRPLRPPPSAPERPRPSVGTRTAARPGFSWLPPERVEVRLRWKRERPVPKPATPKIDEAAIRVHERQRMLVILATGAVLIMSAVVAVRLAVPRSLPREVRGVWRTDAPRYGGRRFELRKGLVVFQAGDSAAAPPAYTITRVWHEAMRAGTLYRVQYEMDGESLLFSFVYRPGRPDQISFANQPGLVWTRLAGATLLRELY